MVKELVDGKAGIDIFQLSNGMTPLMFAAQAGNLELVQFFVAAGAGVNKSSTWDHMTPLMRACSSGHLPVALALLDAGSSVHAYSMGSGQDGLTPLMLAARVGAIEIVEELLKRGADPNARDGWKHDRTSGACGGRMGGWETTARARNPDPKRAHSLPPAVLKFAKETGRSDVIERLVKAGAVDEPTSAANYGIAG